jgi:hypothetical protein
MSRVVLSRLAAVALALVSNGLACRQREQQPVPRVAPAEVTRAPRATRKIERLHPASSRAGQGFNRQPDGQSALAVAGAGFEKGDVVFWNGKPLVTTFADPNLITALVPAKLLEKPGEIVVTVRNPADPESIEVRQAFLLLPP